MNKKTPILDFLLVSAVTFILLLSACIAWDKYGYHDENERDSSPADAAHYSK